MAKDTIIVSDGDGTYFVFTSAGYGQGKRVAEGFDSIERAQKWALGAGYGEVKLLGPKK